MKTAVPSAAALSMSTAKPEGAPVEKGLVTTLDQVKVTPVETPVEKPVEKLVSKPAETVIKPGETPVSKPAVMAAPQPAVAPVPTPAVAPAPAPAPAVAVDATQASKKEAADNKPDKPITEGAYMNLDAALANNGALGGDAKAPAK